MGFLSPSKPKVAVPPALNTARSEASAASATSATSAGSSKLPPISPISTDRARANSGAGGASTARSRATSDAGSTASSRTTRGDDSTVASPNSKANGKDKGTPKKAGAADTPVKSPGGRLKGLLSPMTMSKAKEKMEQKRAELNAKLYAYGPPYQDDYGGNLCEECKQRGASWIEVHQMLSEGGDPRKGDLADQNNTPMHYAARFSHLRICKLLLRAGANINQQNEQGMSPLAVACCFPQAYPEFKKQFRLIKWLVKKGAHVDSVDKSGQTPLHFASANGRKEVVLYLLSQGAVVSKVRDFLSLQVESPIDLALDCPTADTELTRVLFLKKMQEDQNRAKRQADLDQIEVTKRLAEEHLKQRAEKLRQRQEQLAEREAQRDRQRMQRIAAIADKAQAKEEAVKQAASGGASYEAKGGGVADAGPHPSGPHAVWVREQRMHWHVVLDKELKAKSLKKSFDDPEEILQGKTHARHRKKLKKRWKGMTGARLVDMAEIEEEKAKAQWCSQVDPEDLGRKPPAFDGDF